MKGSAKSYKANQIGIYMANCHQQYFRTTAFRRCMAFLAIDSHN
jgi:hypothetical protein